MHFNLKTSHYSAFYWKLDLERTVQAKANKKKQLKINLVIQHSSVDCMNTQLEVETRVPSVARHTKKIIYLISPASAGDIIYLVRGDF